MHVWSYESVLKGQYEMTIEIGLGPCAETSLVKHAGTMRDELERSVEEVQHLHAKIGESACLRKVDMTPHTPSCW